MSLLLALAVAAAATPGRAEATASPPMADAAPAAIVAGAKACVGTIAHPAGVAARFAGWSETVDGLGADDIKSMKAAGGHLYSQNNVRVAVEPGPTGGCAVIAGIPETFDKAAFRSALGQAIGRTVSTSGPTSLPDGEVLVAELGERMAFIMVAGADRTASIPIEATPDVRPPSSSDHANDKGQ